MIELRRPLGLALAGGGAHGAWQAGCLQSLTDGGLAFDKVLGFSAGALSGVAYCLGRQEMMLERWRGIDRVSVFRPAPAFDPFSLFSGEPIEEAVAFAADDEKARRERRCELTVVSLDVGRRKPDYARFTASLWEGPLLRKVAASCSIPWVFPPVRVDGKTLVDGGVPGEEWMRFDALAGCKDVIVLQMVRPDEIGAKRFWPWWRLEQKVREIIARQIRSGIESLRQLSEPPRVFLVYPSAPMDFLQLSFRARNCLPALEMGLRDGAGFVRRSENFLARA